MKRICREIQKMGLSVLYRQWADKSVGSRIDGQEEGSWGMQRQWAIGATWIPHGIYNLGVFINSFSCSYVPLAVYDLICKSTHEDATKSINQSHLLGFPRGCTTFISVITRTPHIVSNRPLHALFLHPRVASSRVKIIVCIIFQYGRL